MLNIKNMSIIAQIGMGFVLVGLIFSAAIFKIGWSFSSLTQGVQQINDKNLPYVLTVDEMDLARSEVQQFLTDAGATHMREPFQEAEASAQKFLLGVEKFKQLYRRENNTDKYQQIEAIETDFNRMYRDGKVMAEAYIVSGLEAGNVLMKGNDTIAGFDQDSAKLMEKLTPFRDAQIAEARQATKTIASVA
ncbi:MAG: hypothetical protein ABL902_03830, partial [Gallionella sp.]